MPNAYLAQQSSLSEALTVIAAALLMAARELLPWLKRRWTSRRVRAVKSGFEGITKMNQTLEGIRRKSGAVRGLVKKLSNGGGVPKPGNQVYGSIIYESDSDKLELAFQRWQQQPLDAPHAEVVSEIVRAGVAPVFHNTKDMKPCAMRSLLEADGVEGFVSYLLGVAPQNWIMYATFHFDQAVLGEEGNILLAPTQMDRLRSGATALRDIVKEYNEVLL